MQYTVNDFFCGCGGMGIGFKNAGFNVIWACDFDKFCVKTYKENVGDYCVLADVRELTYKDVPMADVWTFGFPCQDLSVAGKQKGFEFLCQDCKTEWNYNIYPQAPTDIHCPNCGGRNFRASTRSGCFFEMMRLLDETAMFSPENTPKVLMAENVKGLRKYIPALVAEFEKRGYRTYVQLFNSKYWNVPQNRERYFIVGVKAELPEFSFPQEQHEFIPKLSSALDKNVDDKYYLSTEKANEIIKQALEKLTKLEHCHATITPDRIKKRQNGPRSKANEKEMFTLTAQDIHGVIINNICAETGLLNPDGCAKTLRVGGDGSIDKKHNYQHILISNYYDN